MPNYFKAAKNKEARDEVDLELLQKAVYEANNGMGIREAAEKFGQKIHLVFERVDRENRQKMQVGPKLGGENAWRGSCTPAFSAAEESALALWFEAGEPKFKQDVSKTFLNVVQTN